MTFAAVRSGVLQSASTMAPVPLTTDASLFVDVAPGTGQNLGVAIVNPAEHESSVTMILRDANGSPAGSSAVVRLQPREQIARFVSEVFPDAGRPVFRGSLRLQASSPIGLVALRFSSTSFTIQPAANLAVAEPNAIVFPQFVVGGGWTSEIALVNNTSRAISGRVDVFDQFGEPMRIPLKESSESTFRYSIPADGVVVFGALR
jgi:hypothetical protein